MATFVHLTDQKYGDRVMVNLDLVQFFAANATTTCMAAMRIGMHTTIAADHITPLQKLNQNFALLLIGKQQKAAPEGGYDASTELAATPSLPGDPTTDFYRPDYLAAAALATVGGVRQGQSPFLLLLVV